MMLHLFEWNALYYTCSYINASVIGLLQGLLVHQSTNAHSSFSWPVSPQSPSPRRPSLCSPSATPLPSSSSSSCVPASLCSPSSSPREPCPSPYCQGAIVEPAAATRPPCAYAASPPCVGASNTCAYSASPPCIGALPVASHSNSRNNAHSNSRSTNKAKSSGSSQSMGVPASLSEFDLALKRVLCTAWHKLSPSLALSFSRLQHQQELLMTFVLELHAKDVATPAENRFPFYRLTQPHPNSDGHNFNRKLRLELSNLLPGLVAVKPIPGHTFKPRLTQVKFANYAAVIVTGDELELFKSRYAIYTIVRCDPLIKLAPESFKLSRFYVTYSNTQTHTYAHTHTHIYRYIYI